MAFKKTSVDFAKTAMDQIDPTFTSRFIRLIEFLVDNPETASPIRGGRGPAVGTDEYIHRQALSFIQSRQPRAPTPPSTIPDTMVSFIIHKYFDVPDQELDRAITLHNLSMGAENLIGDILERYIASVVEQHDWVWCSGAMVKAIDFIHKKPDGDWATLQVKNRDNSENSSSAAIRNGTTIAKWFRTFSKKQGDNWDKFPKIVNAELSEKKFQIFVDKYLQSIKAAT